MEENSAMRYGHRVFTQVDRPPSELVARLPSEADIMAKAGTPDLADVMRNTGVVEPAIRPMCQSMPCFAGPVVTVIVPTNCFFVSKLTIAP
jgi:regulator of RNase E activity RraA